MIQRTLVFLSAFGFMAISGLQAQSIDFVPPSVIRVEISQQTTQTGQHFEQQTQTQSLAQERAEDAKLEDDSITGDVRLITQSQSLRLQVGLTSSFNFEIQAQTLIKKRESTIEAKDSSDQAASDFAASQASNEVQGNADPRLWLRYRPLFTDQQEFQLGLGYKKAQAKVDVSDLDLSLSNGMDEVLGFGFWRYYSRDSNLRSTLSIDISWPRESFIEDEDGQQIRLKQNSSNKIRFDLDTHYSTFGWGMGLFIDQQGQRFVDDEAIDSGSMSYDALVRLSLGNLYLLDAKKRPWFPFELIIEAGKSFRGLDATANEQVSILLNLMF